MYVTKGGVIQKIVEDAFPFWSALGWSIDQNRDGVPDGTGGGGSAGVETVNTVSTSGAALTLPDVTTATIHDITLTANCTVTFPSLAAGKSFTVRLTQDATGSRTVTWPATVRWPGGVAPVLSTGAGKQDILSFVSVGGLAWSGFVAGQDLR